MRSRYRVHESDRAHFITSTITGWLPVFTSPACCEILTGSFAYCRERKGLRLHGWVIMENHFHAVVTAPALSAVLADLKKFTARRLLAQLESERRDWLLRLLDEGKVAHKTRSQHQVWQEGFHPQAIQDDAMMIQSRAERDRLRAEPQPGGCRRRAASTWNTFITTRCGADGWRRRSTGAGHRRMNGWPERLRCCYAIRGNEDPPPASETEFRPMEAFPNPQFGNEGQKRFRKNQGWQMAEARGLEKVR